jgi:hypothetical protein
LSAHIHGLEEHLMAVQGRQAPGDRLDPALVRLAAIVLAGVIASLLGTTIVNVALATVSRDLRASVAGVQWVSTGTAPA